MKNKFLIPFLSVSSLTVILMPIITSCSQANKSFSYSQVKDGEFKYPIELRGGYFQSYSEATYSYFKEIENNPIIFCADLVNDFWTQSKHTTDLNSFYSDATLNSINCDTKRISYSFNLNFIHNYNGHIQNISQHVEITNSLMSLSSNVDEHGIDYWTKSSGWKDADAMWLDNKWSIHFHFLLKESGAQDREMDVTANHASKDVISADAKGQVESYMMNTKNRLHYLDNTTKLF